METILSVTGLIVVLGLNLVVQPGADQDICHEFVTGRRDT